MTLPDWKAEDYYSNFESFFYSGPLVNAPIELKATKILQYLGDTVIPDAMKAISYNSELSGLLLVFSVVDYLAGFYCGKNTRMKDVVNFMEKYFPSVYKPYLNDIYQHIRCGLVHTLSLSNPWKNNSFSFKLIKNSKFHLQFKDGFVIFSIIIFTQDTSRAAFMYLHDVINSKDNNCLIRENFVKRFNKKGGAASCMENTDDDFY